MARNEEKALTALNRWNAQKRDLERSVNPFQKGTYIGGALTEQAQFGPYAAKKRPKIASEVNTVKECEHWRTDIVRGVAKKIALIQDASLGEHRIRDLNDEINKDLREKGYWEDQIKALGGADHKAAAPKDVDTYGAELASHSGYKYFGAAKDLPGVRDVFEAEHVPEAPRKSRKQLFKNIQPDYYGWRDEEDGMLLLAEQSFEHEAVAKEVARWKADAASKPPAKKIKTSVGDKPVELSALAADVATTPSEKLKTSSTDDTTAAAGGEKAGKGLDFKAYIDVPTMQDIERLIVMKKKEALLKKYASAEMQQQTSESKELAAGS
eukprot:TRINITY_DN76224_c0_g1_i1.p1 TRINITY_DN76224_c0_g1~~TRINITY_DN76224_c0_g1_i1.p1  ORF type:complete len:324 (-),score=70.78 TRINITY_DN76224_c0_g1_i1:40-1011(-)